MKNRLKKIKPVFALHQTCVISTVIKGPDYVQLTDNRTEKVLTQSQLELQVLAWGTISSLLTV